MPVAGASASDHLPSPGWLNCGVYVAWGFRLPLETAGDERAAAFVEQYTDRSTAPEAGAACEGGFGEPPVPPALPVG